MCKECLANDAVPFRITDDMKSYFYRELSRWDYEKGHLTDTRLAARDRLEVSLDDFRIAQ